MCVCISSLIFFFKGGGGGEALCVTSRIDRKEEGVDKRETWRNEPRHI